MRMAVHVAKPVLIIPPPTSKDSRKSHDKYTESTRSKSIPSILSRIEQKFREINDSVDEVQLLKTDVHTKSEISERVTETKISSKEKRSRSKSREKDKDRNLERNSERNSERSAKEAKEIKRQAEKDLEMTKLLQDRDKLGKLVNQGTTGTQTEFSSEKKMRSRRRSRSVDMQACQTLPQMNADLEKRSRSVGRSTTSKDKSTNVHVSSKSRSKSRASRGSSKKRSRSRSKSSKGQNRSQTAPLASEEVNYPRPTYPMMTTTILGQRKVQQNTNMNSTTALEELKILTKHREKDKSYTTSTSKRSKSEVDKNRRFTAPLDKRTQEAKTQQTQHQTAHPYNDIRDQFTGKTLLKMIELQQQVGPSHRIMVTAANQDSRTSKTAMSIADIASASGLSDFINRSNTPSRSGPHREKPKSARFRSSLSNTPSGTPREGRTPRQSTDLSDANSYRNRDLGGQSQGNQNLPSFSKLREQFRDLKVRAQNVNRGLARSNYLAKNNVNHIPHVSANPQLSCGSQVSHSGSLVETSDLLSLRNRSASIERYDHGHTTHASLVSLPAGGTGSRQKTPISSSGSINVNNHRSGPPPLPSHRPEPFSYLNMMKKRTPSPGGNKGRLRGTPSSSPQRSRTGHHGSSLMTRRSPSPEGSRYRENVSKILNSAKGIGRGVASLGGDQICKGYLKLFSFGIYVHISLSNRTLLS